MSWRELLAYWRDHHDGTRAPSRGDLDPPLEVPALVPHLMLVENLAAGFRLRLVGTEVARRAGKDLTGVVLQATSLEGQSIPEFIAFLKRVVSTAAPLLYSVGRNPESAFGGTGLLLPLPGRSGKVEMVLGGVFYDADGQRRGQEGEPGELTELSLAKELERGPAER
jgi:hypothetical protein